MQTSSDAAAMQGLSQTPMVSKPEAQHSGNVGGSRALRAEAASPASSSHPHRQTGSAAASAKSAAEGGLDEIGAARAALRALTPFVPRLLCQGLSAAAPLLPSLAGLAGLRQPDMASVAKVMLQDLYS